ncbi:hypothetical protein Tco_1563418 [Tanacetum coccineum]
MRYQTLTENEGKTSYEVESGTEPLQLKTFVDVQALLLSDDEMSPPPNIDKPESSPIQDTDESTSDSSPDLKKYGNILPFTERQLVKYLRKGLHSYEENVDHKEQTGKVIDAAMNSLDKNSIARGDLINALNGVTKTLKAIQDVVKEDRVLNKKVIKATKAYTKNSTHLLTLIKNFDCQGLKSSMKSLQATALSQDKHLADWAKSSTSLAWNLGPRMKSIKNSQAEIINKVSSLKQDTSDIILIMTKRSIKSPIQRSSPSTHPTSVSTNNTLPILEATKCLGGKWVHTIWSPKRTLLLFILKGGRTPDEHGKPKET